MRMRNRSDDFMQRLILCGAVLGMGVGSLQAAPVFRFSQQRGSQQRGSQQDAAPVRSSSLTPPSSQLALSQPAFYDFECADGLQPSSLIEGQDGYLYGTTLAGGDYDLGTVFRMPLGGGTPERVYTFGEDGGGEPTGLVLADDGYLYGVAWSGGSYHLGSAFRLSLEGDLTVLYSFTGGADGARPAGLVLASDGSLYGTTYSGDGADVQTCMDGTFCGSVFQVTLAGALTTLHRFPIEEGFVPSFPFTLLEGLDGRFYGAANGAMPGRIFALEPSGDFQWIHEFPESDLEGNYLDALGMDDNGTLYGTAMYGGANALGTGFRMTSSGEMEQVASYAGQFQGIYPMSAVQASDGNTYGTTYNTTWNSWPIRDIHDGPRGWGVLYQMTPSGSISAAFRFDAYSMTPVGVLLEASDGALYGGTLNGGQYGCGALFRYPLP